MTILNNIPVSDNTPTLSAARPRRTLTTRQAWWRAHRRLLKNVRFFALELDDGPTAIAILSLHEIKADDEASLVLEVTAKVCLRVGEAAAEAAAEFDAVRPAALCRACASVMARNARLSHEAAEVLALASIMAHEETWAAESEAAR
jgi:hypothetical protein